MEKLLNKLTRDYPKINFVSGDRFHWSPQKNSVIYVENSSRKNTEWSLLHEVAHARLNHNSYQTDIELLCLEVAAWDEAQKIAQQYNIHIEDVYIQNCLDSYRNWVHQRSTCPNCSNHSLQSDNTHYYCFNCHTTWSVTIARFCRPYRKTETKKTSPSVNRQVMFL